jgi:hypothetical protein
MSIRSAAQRLLRMVEFLCLHNYWTPLDRSIWNEFGLSSNIRSDMSFFAIALVSLHRKGNLHLPIISKTDRPSQNSIRSNSSVRRKMYWLGIVFRIVDITHPLGGSKYVRMSMILEWRISYDGTSAINYDSERFWYAAKPHRRNIYNGGTRAVQYRYREKKHCK